MVTDVRLDQLSWFWIGVASVVPPVVSLLLAFPFWRKGGMIFGNILGTTVIFGTAFALILREAVTLDLMTKACLDAGLPCFPQPAAFTRFAIFAFIGLVEVFALFSVSLLVEGRMRRRDYAPEWR
jgi:hypothetical protein